MTLAYLDLLPCKGSIILSLKCEWEWLMHPKKSRIEVIRSNLWLFRINSIIRWFFFLSFIQAWPLLYLLMLKANSILLSLRIFIYCFILFWSSLCRLFACVLASFIRGMRKNWLFRVSRCLLSLFYILCSEISLSFILISTLNTLLWCNTQEKFLFGILLRNCLLIDIFHYNYRIIIVILNIR